MASELSNTVAVALVRNPRNGALLATTAIAALEAMVLAGGGTPPLITAAVTFGVALAGGGLWWAEGRSHRRLVRDVLAAEVPAPASGPAEVPDERLDALIASVSAVTGPDEARRKVLSDLRRVRDAAAARREVEALAS